MSRPRIGLVGAGKLGGVLAPALAGCGYPLAGVASSDGCSARRLAARLRPRPPVARPAELAEDADWLLLAVPDGALSAVASALARTPADWRRRVVLHHAGALGPEVLRRLASRGAATGLLHPLQSFGTADAAALLDGSWARIEGDRRATAAARRIAADLGLRTLRLAGGAPTSRQRRAYHAAAALAANDLLALYDVALDAFARAGVAERDARPALATLMRGALAQAERHGVERTLTGPVRRGDAETLARHLAALPARGRAVHGLLSREAARIARRSGALDRAALARVLAALDGGD